MTSNPTKTKSPATLLDAPGSERHHNNTQLVHRWRRARDDGIEGDGVIERAALSDSESEPSDEDDTASEEDDNDNDAKEAPGDPAAAAPEASPAPSLCLPVQHPKRTEPHLQTNPRKTPLQQQQRNLRKRSPGCGEFIKTLLDKKKRRKKKKAKGDQSSTPERPKDITCIRAWRYPGRRRTFNLLLPTDSPAAPTPSSSKPPKHVPAYFTARQSYLKRLNSDPAAIPKADSVSPNPGGTVVQAQLQAQAAAKIAERQDAGPSTPTPSNSGRSTCEKPKRTVKNPSVKVSDVLAHAVKERDMEKSKGVVAAAKSELAAAGQQAGTSNVSRASVANAAPTASGAPVQVKLPGSAATGHQHRSTAPPTADPLTTTPRQAVQPRPPAGSTVAGQQKRASDAVASPPATQPPITVNAPLVTQPSTNPGYSYVVLPPGIAMGESGILFEIATGRPVVLNPQANAPPAPIPPLPHPTMSPGGPVYNPRPLTHSHVSRPGSMAYIPPHVLNSLGVSSATPDSSSATPPSFPGYPGSPPAQSQPQTTVVPQLTYAPQPQYPASTTHISEAAQAAAYAAAPPPPPPDQYYNSGYYAIPGVNPSGYSGVPTVIGGQTFYNQAYYPQPYGYGPGAEYGYGPPPAPDESYGAYARQQIAGDPDQQERHQMQQMQQAPGASQGYPSIQAAYY
ncbi:hypothetical protein FRB90_005617 [Tulasnella sp. 427]|nr:hypothetical protein FRB90_005617 [Tulasnella sp. 427]